MSEESDVGAIYRKHKIHPHRWLVARKLLSAHLTAALEKKEVSSNVVSELVRYMGALEKKGTKPEQQRRFKQNFDTFAEEAEGKILRKGLVAALEELRERMRLLAETRSIAEARFFDDGRVFERIAALGEGAPGARDKTVMFRLADLEAKNPEHERESERELEEFERSMSEGRVRCYVRKLAAQFKRVGGFVQAARSRLPTRSRVEPTEIHSLDVLSPAHVAVLFHPKVKLVEILPKVQSTNVHVLPGENLSAPISLSAKGSAPKIHRFSETTDRYPLRADSAFLSVGHAFSTGENELRVKSLGRRKVELVGVSGPVAGRVFRFNPAKRNRITIGSAANDNICIKPKR